MTDNSNEKQQPTAEQIAQWKKEAKELFPQVTYTNGLRWMDANLEKREAYITGRQKSFEEVARLQAELEDRVKCEQIIAKDYKDQRDSLQQELALEKADNKEMEICLHSTAARVSELEGQLKQAIKVLDCCKYKSVDGESNEKYRLELRKLEQLLGLESKQ